MMRPPHTDRDYEQQLSTLREQILRMGARVEGMIDASIRALMQRNDAFTKEVIDSDRLVDRLEVEVDHLCLTVLARRQPVASDLRFLTTALKIVTDLERIADLAVNISERTIELNLEPPLKPCVELPLMAQSVQTMVREALDAFVAQNVEAAYAVLERDHGVDAHYGQIFRDLLTCMIAEPQSINRNIKLLAIAKHLERMGDHAVNLAEMVIFMARGQDVRHLASQREVEGRPHGVLFLCVHNAARSQIAEAWATQLFPSGVRIWSAGSAPRQHVDPRTVQVMREVGIDIAWARPKHVAEIPLGDVDHVITLCRDEQCPVLPGMASRVAWDLPDPTALTGSEAEMMAGWRQVRDAIRARVEALVESWQ